MEAPKVWSADLSGSGPELYAAIMEDPLAVATLLERIKGDFEQLDEASRATVHRLADCVALFVVTELIKLGWRKAGGSA